MPRFEQYEPPLIFKIDPTTRGRGLRMGQVSHGEPETSGNHILWEGKPVIMLSSFPGRESLVGMRLHSPGGPVPGQSPCQEPRPVWQRHVCLRPSSGPKVTGPGPQRAAHPALTPSSGPNLGDWRCSFHKGTERPSLPPHHVQLWDSGSRPWRQA